MHGISITSSDIVMKMIQVIVHFLKTEPIHYHILQGVLCKPSAFVLNISFLYDFSSTTSKIFDISLQNLKEASRTGSFRRRAEIDAVPFIRTQDFKVEGAEFVCHQPTSGTSSTRGEAEILSEVVLLKCLVI